MGSNVTATVDVYRRLGNPDGWHQVWDGSVDRNYEIYTLLGVDRREPWTPTLHEPRPAMAGSGMSSETALAVWPLSQRGEQVWSGMSCFPGPLEDEDYAGWLTGAEVMAVQRVIVPWPNLDELVESWGGADPVEHVRVHFWVLR
jgi:hypothetical protein